MQGFDERIPVLVRFKPVRTAIEPPDGPEKLQDAETLLRDRAIGGLDGGGVLEGKHDASLPSHTKKDCCFKVRWDGNVIHEWTRPGRNVVSP